ncbi:MAG: hypothetical protein WC222_05375 [Parachlamydiales bacterium]|jgi:hypothetical protein
MSTDPFLFRLLSYNTAGNLKQLIQEEDYQKGRVAQIQRYGILALAWKTGNIDEKNFSRQESKILRDKIEQLANSLTSEFFRSVQDKGMLSVLKTKVDKISKDGILLIVENEIIKLKINDSKLVNSLTRLNEVIQEIVSNHMSRNKSAIFYLPSQHSPVSPSSSPNIAARYLMASDHLKEIQDSQRLETFSRETSNETNGSDKVDNVMSSILILDRLEDISQVVQNFGSLQVVSLLYKVERCASYHHKTAKILSTVSVDVLEEILFSADIDWIKKVNEMFRKVPSNEMRTAMRDIRKKFIERNNSTKNEIDAINDRFRSISITCELTCDDIKEIDRLSYLISIRSEATKKLLMLFEGLIKDSETLHSLKELISQYHHFSLRLSNSEEVYSCVQDAQHIKELIHLNSLLMEKHKGDPQSAQILKMLNEHLEKNLAVETNSSLIEGCPYGIIYRNHILDNDLVASSKAFELLSACSIYTRRDYIECGILKEDEAGGLKPHELNVIVSDKLKAMGIRKVSDWFRIKVFNKQTLREFMRTQ